MATIEERVGELKLFIERHDGENAADRRFAGAVDDLVSAVYDDIAQIRVIPSRALFDLFVIKVLYVGMQSRHADVVDYLGRLLESFLYTHALFPVDAQGRPRTLYFSDVLDQQRRPRNFQNRFEAYRRYADGALFFSGVLAASLHPRRSSSRSVMRRRSAPTVDASYYVSTGKTMYRMASQQELAEETKQRDTLGRLSEWFEVYAGALNEMSERYILGFDMALIADKMLDHYNRYRQTGDESYLTNARRYAAILRLDPARLSRLLGPEPA
jgi:hypothetical protein